MVLCLQVEIDVMFICSNKHTVLSIPLKMGLYTNMPGVLHLRLDGDQNSKGVRANAQGIIHI